MTKTFSTKLDSEVLRLLDDFCRRYHLKKSSLVSEMLAEGIRRKAEAMQLAASIDRGLEQEKEGNLYTAEEVEHLIFRKKKAN